MRQDEIDRLPDSIEYAKVEGFLVSLGITPTDVAAMHMTDAHGRKFLAEDGAAKHTVSLKMDYGK
ncbi:hypothetical protein [Kribbella sp. NPDC050470]|uniref:hypothetical protein n=1 Tax=unclassified Kribbella TaxID=2644121 RepID=UPI00378BEAD1